MPLSEHEQRMLEQMEHALAADDPKFASSMVGIKTGRQSGRIRLIVAIFGAIAGLGLVFVGINTNQWVGAAGFALMVASVALALSPGRRPDLRAVRDDDSPPPRPTPKGSGFMEKLDNRWDRRSNSDWI